ncbi:MAG: hypothetical protein H6Q15_896 [Bacteroidetes bacterium]|nr:hypothetical protein [Bacteroidota bacterium]
MEKFKIKIAEEFSTKPGGRQIKYGPFSGEAFYKELLEKRFDDAIKTNEKLYIYLDGTGSYGSSFLDESFGQLAREKGRDLVINNIVFVTETFDWIVDYIKKEVWGEK